MLRILTRLGFLVGLLFIVLLSVAIPLKFWFGFPEVGYVLGGLYGLLLVTYTAALVIAVTKHDFSAWILPIALVCTCIPFAPFVFDQVVLEGYRRKLESS